VINFPPDLPENSAKFGRLFAHINRLSNAAQALIPRQAHGTKTTRTAIGVTIEASPRKTEAVGGQQVWL